MLNRNFKQDNTHTHWVGDITFRKHIYATLEQLQMDVNQWVLDYNINRPHSGKYCYGKTPMQTFQDAKPIMEDKVVGYNRELTDSETTLGLAVS